MTSKEFYAQREVNAFDVDKFIGEVYNKFAGTLGEESREDLKTLWHKVMTMPRGGDASLYPNADGPRPAMLEVWLKAGDFWRAGYRNGDELFCDQYGIVLQGWQVTKINEAKGLNANIAENAAETPRNDASASGRATAGGTTEVPAESETDASMACEEYAPLVPDIRNSRSPRRRRDKKPVTRAPRKPTRHFTISPVARGLALIAAIIVTIETGLIIPAFLVACIAGGTSR